MKIYKHSICCDNIASSSSTSSDRYINRILHSIHVELSNAVDSIEVDYTHDDIVVVVGFDGNVKQYTVPLSDLNLSLATIDDDVSYIVNEIKRDLDIHNVDEESVASSYEFNNNAQDFVNYVKPVLEKLASVGCDVRDGRVIDYAESAAEMIANDDDHDVDFWWHVTTENDEFMDEVDALPHVDR